MTRPYDPLLPTAPADPYLRNLNLALVRNFRDLANRLSALAGGSLAGKESRGTAAPTVGTWAQGDEVTNSNPTEAGTAGSKYVVTGWKCVTGGTPGTWVQMRSLTGN